MTDRERSNPATQLATQLAQALGFVDAGTGALVPPLHSTTTFVRDERYELPGKWSYGRPDNPTAEVAEGLLATLEGGAGAMLFASGTAAAFAAVQTVAPGERIVAPKAMYWALRRWLTESVRAFGVEVVLVDMTDLDALAAAAAGGRTRLVWAETPANPTWEITDLAAAADIAHRAGAILFVDNTVPTPLLTRPLQHGADLVMHSATKYLNGHSDVLAGALVGARDDALWRRLDDLRDRTGGIVGPFEAWLLLRGMRTLHLRLREACRNAQAIAERLAGHPAVASVLYPGLPGHPGHAIAARQMRGGFGGMLSLRMRGGSAAARRGIGQVRLWKRATSLGGVESLIEHRASIEGPDSPVPPDLLRLSTGIEDVGDLIADLEQAFAGLG